MLEPGREIRHLEKARSGQYVVTKLRRRRHEKIGGDAEIQRLHRFATAARIGVGHDRVRAEVQKRFDGIRPLVENSGEDIVRRAVARLGRWAEGLEFAANALSGGLLGEKFLAVHFVYRDDRKNYVAAGAVEIADERVE